MKYYGKIQDPKDLITKEYADSKVATTPNILKGDNAGHAVAAEVEEATLVDFTPIPTPTASDNGKFLRVSNGSAAWETVPTMTGGSY